LLRSFRFGAGQVRTIGMLNQIDTCLGCTPVLVLMLGNLLLRWANQWVHQLVKQWVPQLVQPTWD
jgi:hypothetical protein